ncbi:MAG: pal [Chlamydiales bacterium]|jgi:peptidoglycan-associated lipoprotein|nr:pal [Chlamydiales bacterium]
MKLSASLIQLNLAFLLLFSASCRRSSEEVWDDTKTASHYMGKGFRSLGGKHGDSKQIQSREEFEQSDEAGAIARESDFIPLQDLEGQPLPATESALFRQSRLSPGDPTSPIPGIESFSDPLSDVDLSRVFRRIHFAYNRSLIEGGEAMEICKGIARYLKTHTDLYLFIEGHCDERGPQAYNLALGLKRANAIRHFLIEQGINPDRLFVISYGKERPLRLEKTEDAYALNRRAQFRIFKRR